MPVSRKLRMELTAMIDEVISACNMSQIVAERGLPKGTNTHLRATWLRLCFKSQRQRDTTLVVTRTNLFSRCTQVGNDGNCKFCLERANVDEQKKSGCNHMLAWFASSFTCTNNG